MFREPTLRLNARQNQSLTPRLQQAVRLLQLSTQEYAQELQEFALANPFLELEDTITEFAPRSEGRLAELPAAAEGEPTDAQASAPADGTVQDSLRWGDASEIVYTTSANRDSYTDSSMEAHEYTAAKVGLQDHLRTQAKSLPISLRDQALIEVVIDSIDDDGYVRLDLDDIEAMSDFEPSADDNEIRMALKLVQSFEPLGVGARSLSECLLLQMEHLPPATHKLATRIITDYLDRLARNDVASVSRALGAPRAEVEAACAAIRLLDPRPGVRFRPADTAYVTPDVIVQKVRNEWVASLNSGVVPRLRMSQQVADLFQRHREPGNGGHAQLGTYLQEARWTLRNMEKRFSTILEVAQAIVVRQQAYFEYGPLAMKPLALSQIADEVGVHESTVCRVTNNKYMTTPSGTRELKYFFSRPMPVGTSQSCSGIAIRALVQEMIAGENRAHPLSDVLIARQLEREGVNVARRTVTKYRQSLSIPSADRRQL